jgi:hypothetical protein
MPRGVSLESTAPTAAASVPLTWASPEAAAPPVEAAPVVVSA